MNTLAAPSVTDDSGKKLADPRVRDAEQGYAIYKRLRKDDSEASWKRANIDYQIDGGKPFEEEVMIDAGRGDETNENFREARAEDDAAQTPFIEMTTVARVLWNIRTAFGDPAEQDRYGKIISEEFTRTVREWGADFDFYRLRLTQQFTRHGVAFLYWENETDWRWRADGLSSFKLPHGIESRPSAIPYCACEREMTVDELYGHIRNEKAAREVGRWNVDAVKQAIGNCVFTSDWFYNTENWELVVRKIRENDTTVGAVSPKVKLYHLWAKEFDGTISHYIGLQTGAVKIQEEIAGNGWLYEHRSRFKALEKCIIPFFYGVGTHGTIHTIRGQGEMNFGPIAISNRSHCRFVDLVDAASSIIMQADSPNDAEGAAYIRRGPFTIVSGSSKIQATAMPDVSQRMLPLLRQMQMLRQNVTGSFQARAITEQGTQERTKYEVQAQQNQSGTLESARLTLFFGPWSRAGQEMFDRMMAPNLRDDDAGGREAYEFRLRCLKRGVPMEALEDVFSVDAVRTIGYGSPETRQYSSEKIYQMSGGFDQVGQRKAKLDVVAALPGVDYQMAEEYVGPEEPRLTIDDQIAELENNDFRKGQPIKVIDGQNPWTHCQHHAALVNETVDAFNKGQMEGAQLVPILTAALDNMQQHSEQLDKDVMKVKEAGYVRKFLQEKNGILQQQEQKLIAEMQRQQEAAQQAQQQPGADGQPQQLDPEEERKWQAHQQEMQIKRQEFENRQREFDQKLAMQSQEAAQRRNQRDLDLAAKLASKRAQIASTTTA